MRKHYILIWIDDPGFNAREKRASWVTLVAILVKRAETTEGIITLGQNSWLLPRDSGLPFLAECIERARNNGLAAHTMFLDG